jgi:hypothetical protein
MLKKPFLKKVMKNQSGEYGKTRGTLPVNVKSFMKKRG